MHALSVIALGLLLLVLQGALLRVFPLWNFLPNPVLPIAVYMGITSGVSVTRGAALSFALGYLYDLHCGGSLGLQTFVLVASFLFARGASARILPKGSLYHVPIMLGMAALSGSLTLGLLAVFEPAAPFPTDNANGPMEALLASAVATTLTAPPVFRIMRRIHEWLLPRQGSGHPAEGVS